jgi:transcriptional regulator with XRE-family HTH domain
MKPPTPLGALRRSKGLTLAQVAALMKSNVPSVSDFEAGKSDVGAEYISRYARALRVPVRKVALKYWLGVQVRSIARLEVAQRMIRGRCRRTPLKKLP